MTALRLTDAGRAAVADGANRAMRAIQIRSIEIGTGAAGVGSDDARTALRARQATAPATGSSAVAGRIAVRGTFAASASYDVREVGIIARIGDAGDEFLFAYRAAATPIARAISGTTLIVGVVIEVTRSTAEITVTVDASLSVSIASDVILHSADVDLVPGAAATEVALASSLAGYRWIELEASWVRESLPPPPRRHHRCRIPVSLLDRADVARTEVAIWILGTGEGERTIWLLRDIAGGSLLRLTTIDRGVRFGLTASATQLYAQMDSSIWALSNDGSRMGAALATDADGDNGAIAWANDRIYYRRYTGGKEDIWEVDPATRARRSVLASGQSIPTIVTGRGQAMCDAGGGKLLLFAHRHSDGRAHLFEVTISTGVVRDIGVVTLGGTGCRAGVGAFLLPAITNPARSVILGGTLDPVVGADVTGLFTVNTGTAAATLLRAMELPSSGLGGTYHSYGWTERRPNIALPEEQSIQVYRAAGATTRIQVANTGTLPLRISQITAVA